MKEAVGDLSELLDQNMTSTVCGDMEPNSPEATFQAVMSPPEPHFATPPLALRLESALPAPAYALVIKRLNVLHRSARAICALQLIRRCLCLILVWSDMRERAPCALSGVSNDKLKI